MLKRLRLSKTQETCLQETMQLRLPASADMGRDLKHKNTCFGKGAFVKVCGRSAHTHTHGNLPINSFVFVAFVASGYHTQACQQFSTSTNPDRTHATPELEPETLISVTLITPKRTPNPTRSEPPPVERRPSAMPPAAP